MLKYSILDLATVGEGISTKQTFENVRNLAQHAEEWGYHRFWLAEHHNMKSIASSATSVLMGYLAEGTKSIRRSAWQKPRNENQRWCSRTKPAA